MRHLPFGHGINTGDVFRCRGDVVAPGLLSGISLPVAPIGAVTIIVTSGGINTLYSGGVSLIGPGCRILPPAAYSVSGRLISLIDTPPAGDVYSLDFMASVPSDLSTATFTAGADPDFAYNKSLLHFNGSSGGTTFADVMGRSWTANNATTDTAWKQFGTASVALGAAATPSYIETPHSADFEITNQDFFIEMTVRPASIPTASHYHFLATKDDTGATRSWQLALSGDTGTFGFVFWSGATPYSASSSTVPVANTPYVISAGRTAGTLYFFVNGILENTTTVGSTANNSSSNVVRLGISADSVGPTQSFCNMDEFRFALGLCRHTTNYTPAVTAFSDF